jgi:hypothetical protein
MDMFAYFGVFSVGFGGVSADLEERNAAFFANPAKSNDMVKMFWIGAGNNDSIIGNGGYQLCESLSHHGIEYEFHKSKDGQP